jgi:cellulose synthase/poly-beta-1,6-N-acetylglucosamine synthase-like glycosyltransferase
VRRETIFPCVTIVLAVRNEQNKLPAKLQNLALLDYPAERVEMIVVSDGSTDDTNRILAEWQARNRRAVILSDHRGKDVALDRGVAEALGEIVVFTDARQIIAPDALKNLVANFADRSVGGASGELVIAERSTATSSQGVGLYWRMEKKVRYWESLSGSTVGATGAFYAVRRSLIAALPEGTILDDVYIPLQVVQQGFRVVFEPRAIATDDLTPGPRKEFRRKVRTLTGNYQLLRLSPWLLTRANPVRFEFVCHKLLRLLTPFALVSLFVASLLLMEAPYRVVLAIELIFTGLAAVAMLRPKHVFLSRLADAALAFLVLNTAAAVAFYYFVSRKKQIWV